MAKDKVKEADQAAEAGEAEGEAADAAPKKKPPLKLVIIGGVAALLVLGGGGVGAYLLMKPKAGDAAHAEKAEKPKKKKKEEGHAAKGGEAAKGAAVVREGPNGVVFYTLPDVVVNMQTADGRPTFLKLKLTLELADAHVVEALDPSLPRLQDMFQTFLRELRPEDLSGSQGSYQLRMEILRRVNLVIAPSRVDAVLIEEMLIN